MKSINKLLLSGVARDILLKGLTHSMIAGLEGYLAEVQNRQYRFFRFALYVISVLILFRLLLTNFKFPHELSVEEASHFATGLKLSKVGLIADYYTYITSLAILFLFSEVEA